jgi:MarR family transcriptional regulator, temperature-dependent positive regulator of motility
MHPANQLVDLRNPEKALSYFQSRPGFVLRRTQQLLTVRFASECRRAEIDITESQLDALAVIAADQHTDQITLAHRLGYDRSTIASVINGLTRRRLVKRLIKGDRRRRLLELTPDARRTLAAARRCSKRADDTLLACLSTAERTQLLQVLTEVATHPDSLAPLWEPLVKGADISRKRHVLPGVYRTPRFLMGRCIQVGGAFLGREIGKFGITGAQLGVLFLVAISGPVDQTTIGRALQLDKSSASMMISSLQARGLVRRSADPHHGRRVLVLTTRAGWRGLEKILPRAARADDRVFEGLSSDARDRFCSLLSRVVNAQLAAAR